MSSHDDSMDISPAAASRKRRELDDGESVKPRRPPSQKREKGPTQVSRLLDDTSPEERTPYFHENKNDDAPSSPVRASSSPVLSKETTAPRPAVAREVTKPPSLPTPTALPNSTPQDTPKESDPANKTVGGMRASDTMPHVITFKQTRITDPVTGRTTLMAGEWR
jgi:hypothetical protein